MVAWFTNCKCGKNIVVWFLMAFGAGFVHAQNSNFQLSGPLRGLYQGMEQGQQEALQAQQIEYQRQMVEQQRMQNEQMRRQQMQLQQQQQEEAARQQQLYQMQMENERLKRQLLEQQANKSGSKPSPNSIKPQNNSVKLGGYCVRAQDCQGAMICVNNVCK